MIHNSLCDLQFVFLVNWRLNRRVQSAIIRALGVDDHLIDPNSCIWHCDLRTHVDENMYLHLSHKSLVG